MSDSNITVMGNVASDVRSRASGSTTVASFRLASQRRYFNRHAGRWVDDEAAFYRVVCWRATAEHVAACVKKGEPVIVYGRVRLKDWTDDKGNRRTDVEIEAFNVGYDLARGTAAFTRTRRQVQQDSDADPLEDIRSEQRASVDDEIVVDPTTGEVFSVRQLQRDRDAGDQPSRPLESVPKQEPAEPAELAA